MKNTAHQIAQWVIDNRHQSDKVNDFEMYHEIVVMIENVNRKEEEEEEVVDVSCIDCKYYHRSINDNPCSICDASYSEFIKK